MQAAEEEEDEEEESSTQNSAMQQQEAASPHSLVAAAQPRGYVVQWLASSGGEQQALHATAAFVDGSQPAPSVACLVQHFEALPIDQPAAPQPPLTELASAEPAAPIQPARLLANRLRLAPLQIDDDLALNADSEAAAAAVPDTSYSPGTDESGVQPSMPGTAATTPTARYQSALQGATARNQAAIAAHRARLHLKEHSAAGGTRQHGSVALPSHVH